MQERLNAMQSSTQYVWLLWLCPLSFRMSFRLFSATKATKDYGFDVLKCHCAVRARISLFSRVQILGSCCWECSPCHLTTESNGTAPALPGLPTKSYSDDATCGQVGYPSPWALSYLQAGLGVLGAWGVWGVDQDQGSRAACGIWEVFAMFALESPAVCSEAEPRSTGVRLGPRQWLTLLLAADRQVTDVLDGTCCPPLGKLPLTVAFIFRP